MWNGKVVESDLEIQLCFFILYWKKREMIIIFLVQKLFLGKSRGGFFFFHIHNLVGIFMSFNCHNTSSNENISCNPSHSQVMRSFNIHAVNEKYDFMRTNNKKTKTLAENYWNIHITKMAILEAEKKFSFFISEKREREFPQANMQKWKCGKFSSLCLLLWCHSNGRKALRHNHICGLCINNFQN